MTGFKILPFPAERKVIVDAGYAAWRRHVIYGLVEVDVTEARERILAAREQEGGDLSFTAFIVASLAQAIAAEPKVQALRDWRGRLVVFEDVDVVTLIEAQAGRVAIPHVIRAANRRTVAEISAEIRAVQARPQQSKQSGGLVKLAGRLPRWVRLMFYGLLKLNPHQFKRIQGTALVTSVGVFGKHSGWGVPFLPFHTLGLTVGGIGQKPGVHEGRIEIREYLSLTLAFDHDIVDGAPAARFGRRLVELIECAEVLGKR